MGHVHTDSVVVSVVIATYGREQVLLDTIGHLLPQVQDQGEIVVVDQTITHESETEAQLRRWDDARAIRWIRRSPPSITAAMNAGLLAAHGDVVIYIDDDVIPDPGFIDAHLAAHQQHSKCVVAGRVLQPWHSSGDVPLDGLAGQEAGPTDEFIGCNFSVARELALAIGGFDERFVKVAYRYEAEFALRAARAGYRTEFWPQASLRHLRLSAGGTRSYGDHLRTFLPAHSVGEYYFLIGSRPCGWAGLVLRRLLRSPMTRHHLRRPWWILPTLISEVSGLAWALSLAASGKRLVGAGA